MTVILYGTTTGLYNSLSMRCSGNDLADRNRFLFVVNGPVLSIGIDTPHRGTTTGIHNQLMATG